MKPADSEKSNGMCLIYFYVILNLSKLKQTQHRESFCFTPYVVKMIWDTPGVLGKMLACSELQFILSFKEAGKSSETPSSLYLLHAMALLTVYVFLLSSGSEMTWGHLILIRRRWNFNGDNEKET